MAQNQSSTIVIILLLVFVANIIGHFWEKVIDKALGVQGEKYIVMIAILSTMIFIILLIILTQLNVISEDVEEQVLINI